MPGDSAPAVGSGPYTVADLEVTPQDGRRYELIDGGLYVTASSTPLHQLAAGRLCNLLAAAAAPQWDAVQAVDVRCGPDTVLRPDVVVLLASVIDSPERVVACGHLAMVAEIASPSTARVDRLLRPRLYAQAGIGGYLLVQTNGPSLTWFSLPGRGDYSACRSASGAEPLRLSEPFQVQITAQELTGRRR
jgi:Uma2 family endonuclease